MTKGGQVVEIRYPYHAVGRTGDYDGALAQVLISKGGDGTLASSQRRDGEPSGHREQVDLAVVVPGCDDRMTFEHSQRHAPTAIVRVPGELAGPGTGGVAGVRPPPLRSRGMPFPHHAGGARAGRGSARMPIDVLATRTGRPDTVTIPTPRTGPLGRPVSGSPASGLQVGYKHAAAPGTGHGNKSASSPCSPDRTSFRGRTLMMNVRQSGSGPQPTMQKLWNAVRRCTTFI